MKPDFSGLSYDQLTSLRSQFMELAGQAFNELVSGKKTVAKEMYIDTDLFHDRPPRRWLELAGSIVIRQEERRA